MCSSLVFWLFFVCKQKTAYEMRISDWRSYVCSSDLQGVFANMLGFINGRVYYNLRSWHHLLAMLPGYSLNARFMEQMMGVKERFDVPKSYHLSKGTAWKRILKMAIHMYTNFRTLPRQRTAFKKLLDQTIDQYKAMDFQNKDANELMAL